MRRNVEQPLTRLVLLWTGRITSIASVALLLMFATNSGLSSLPFSDPAWLGLLFFPIGVVVGFAVAWARPRAGALLAIGALCGFYAWYWVARGSLPAGAAFLLFTAPALPFLLSERPTASAPVLGSGSNVTVFALFFGLALLESVRTRQWTTSLLWVAFALLFVLADVRRRRDVVSGSPEAR